jgi:hypothetical protein
LKKQKAEIWKAEERENHAFRPPRFRRFQFSAFTFPSCRPPADFSFQLLPSYMSRHTQDILELNDQFVNG